jgi:hypothetical protein
MTRDPDNVIGNDFLPQQRSHSSHGVTEKTDASPFHGGAVGGLFKLFDLKRIPV